MRWRSWLDSGKAEEIDFLAPASFLLRASKELIKGYEREGLKRSLLFPLMLLPLSRKEDTTHKPPLVFG